MASIDCAKFTGGQAGGLSVHFDEEKRLECNHSNPHIDKSKTHLNSFHDCAGYSEMLHKQKSRVAEADKDHPPERVRKDRITTIMMEIPVPKSISDKGLTDQFLQDTYAMIGKMVGKENMCGLIIHRDEIHDYIDHGGKTRTSLEHGHAMVVPYARWMAKETVYGEDGKPLRDKAGKIVKQDVKREGVNAKHFLTRSFLKKLQDKMQEMVLEKYGISYQTSQEPLHMTVEDLKRDSARAAAIIERAEQHAKEAEQRADFQNLLADSESVRADSEHERAEMESERAAKAKAVTQAEEERSARARSKAAEAVQQAKAAEAKVKALDGQSEALTAQITAQLDAYSHNDALIRDQEIALGLIQTVEQYQGEADELVDAIDEAEKFVVQDMPVTAKLFKASAAETFLHRMEVLLDKLRKYIEIGIQRLRIYERTHVVKSLLSEPVQRRATALDKTVAGAFAQYRHEGGSEGLGVRQKDDLAH